MSFVIWTSDFTQRYLDANPLPADFTWKHRDDVDWKTPRPVHPSHKSVTSYGKWLRETPYFPGLFELAHQVLARSPDVGDAEWLAAELVKFRAEPAHQVNIF